MRLLLILLHLLVFTNIQAQESTFKNKYWGFQVGISHYNTTLPEGRKYIPYQLLGLVTLHNFTPKKKMNWWLYTEPQWVYVDYDTDHPFDLEFGCNLGFKIEFPLTDLTLLTAGIGAGPHIITANTTDQSRGFIFSDNMEVGIRKLFKNSDWEAHLKWRWRHISNANINPPNDGIDNLVIVAGFAKRFRICKEF